MILDDFVKFPAAHCADVDVLLHGLALYSVHVQGQVLIQSAPRAQLSDHPPPILEHIVVVGLGVYPAVVEDRLLPGVERPQQAVGNPYAPREEQGDEDQDRDPDDCPSAFFHPAPPVPLLGKEPGPEFPVGVGGLPGGVARHGLWIIKMLTTRFFILFLLPWFCILRGITAWKGLN